MEKGNCALHFDTGKKENKPCEFYICIIDLTLVRLIEVIPQTYCSFRLSASGISAPHILHHHFGETGKKWRGKLN